MQVANLGYIENPSDEFQHPTEPEVGLGVSPELPFGKLDLMLDYKSLSYDENEEKIHAGILFGFGAMSLGAGVDNYGGSTGIFYSLEQINAGILYSTTQLPWRKDDYYAQTVYVQVGWQL